MAVEQRSTGVSGEPEERALLIPAPKRVQGPLLRIRIRRSLAVYAVVWLLGIAPSLLGLSPPWRAFGLGLVLPGGGFVYTSDPVFAVVSVLAALGAFWVLFTKYNHVLLPVVWLAAAAAATLRTDSGLWEWSQWAVPATAVALIAAMVVRKRFEFRRNRKVGAARNVWLESVRFDAPPKRAELPVASELTPDDLAVQRWVLDRALQPVEEWEGFELGENSSTMSPPRYQLNWMQWALALSQLCRTPAFDGYLSLAQRNLIEKMADLEAWGYWRKLNLWGNLRADPDPIPRDNVMYSGYWSLMIELYASNTGDHRYDEPDCFELRWDDRRVFRYDAGSIADAVERNLMRTGWGMFPCEPGFVFPVCNTFAVEGLVARAKNNGTEADDALLRRFRQTLDEEFTTPRGSIHSNIFYRYGFTNSVLNTVTSDAATSFYVHPLVPDVSARTWEIVRREHLRQDELGVEIESAGIGKRLDEFDPGNYVKSRAFSSAAVAMAALEMGDEEIARGALARADHEPDLVVENGSRSFTDASNFTNANHALARFGRRNGWHDLVTAPFPDHWRSGPVLAEAPYPEVLVARAVTDGHALSLVLRPGTSGGRYALRLGRLVPGRAYELRGAVERELTAAPDGSADVDVDLDVRLDVDVIPT